MGDDAVVTVEDVTSDTPGLSKLAEVKKLSKKGLEPEIIKVRLSCTVFKQMFINTNVLFFDNFTVLMLGGWDNLLHLLSSKESAVIRWMGLTKKIQGGRWRANGD